MALKRQWYGLSWAEKRQVLRLARKGRRHPDPEIAMAAEQWARETLQPAAKRRILWGIPLSFIEGAVGGGWLGMSIAEIRAAKRVLALAQNSRE